MYPRKENKCIIGRSRLGKGTKNLLDKWKQHASKSVDVGRFPIISNYELLNQSCHDIWILEYID